MHPATCTTLETVWRRRSRVPGCALSAVDDMGPVPWCDDRLGGELAGDDPDWRLGVEVDAAFPAGFEDLAEVEHGVYAGDLDAYGWPSAPAKWELILHDVVRPF